MNSDAANFDNYAAFEKQKRRKNDSTQKKHNKKCRDGGKITAGTLPLY